MRQSFLPGFQGDVPYVVVEAELVEQQGLRMIARLRDSPETQLKIGLPVKTVFEDSAVGPPLPCFQLVRT